jgi:hypothetical protein
MAGMLLQVTLQQENNAVALMDLKTETAGTTSFSAGTASFDLELTFACLIQSKSNVILREPYGIAWLDDRYFSHCR